MKKQLVSEAQIRAAAQYLKSYRFHSRVLRTSEQEKRKGRIDMPWEEAMCRTELFRVRQFITNLNDSDEKLFLYYHYIRGESVEACAEMLGICRSSGFRLKRRALSLAATHLTKEEDSGKDSVQDIS